MSEGQNIPGVPEGWRLVAIRPPRRGEYYVGDHNGLPVYSDADWGMIRAAIIERIPQPKRMVLVAEWDLPICDHEAGAVTADFGYGGGWHRTHPNRTRIEERDA